MTCCPHRMGSLTLRRRCGRVVRHLDRLPASVRPEHVDLRRRQSRAYPGLAPRSQPVVQRRRHADGLRLTNTCPGVYLPPSVTTSGGHIAITPSWGSVTPFVNTASQVDGIVASVGTPYNISSPAYAQDWRPPIAPAASAPLACRPASAPPRASPAERFAGNGTTKSFLDALTTRHRGPGTPVVQSALTDNALFWNDPGTTEQPPGHWLDITDTTILRAGSALSELQQAQMTMPWSARPRQMPRSPIWNDKYAYNLWRPITAITGINAPGSFVPTAMRPEPGTRRSAATGYGFTCDAAWKSYITTPPHPDFTAGHPGFSGAAATILTDYLGEFDPEPAEHRRLLQHVAVLLQHAGRRLDLRLHNGAEVTAAPITAPFISNADGSLSTTIIGCLRSPMTTMAYDNDLQSPPSNTGVIREQSGRGVRRRRSPRPSTTSPTRRSDATDSRVNGGIHTPLAINDAFDRGQSDRRCPVRRRPSRSRRASCHDGRWGWSHSGRLRRRLAAETRAAPPEASLAASDRQLNPRP